MSSGDGPVPTGQDTTSRNMLYLGAGAVLLVLAILAILLFVRPGSQNGTETPSTEDGLQFTIQRLSPAVFMGASDPLPEVSADAPQPFPLNFLATTSQDGEAVIKGEVEGASCSIFLFFDTRLERSACNRAASDGNTTCLEEGSAVFENCHNHLVQTASGEVKLLGTWASVTYLPDQKLTLLAVTQGVTTVRPVLDEASQTMGSPVEVGAGEYLYSAPDQELRPVAGVPERKALPLYKIGPVLAQYPQAFDWITRAMERSKAYGVDPVRFEPTPTETPSPVPIPTFTPSPTDTATPVYTFTPTALAVVPPTATYEPLPTVMPVGQVVIPELVRVDAPALDGSCDDIAYRQAYAGSFEVGRRQRANIYLLQDANRLYICASYPNGIPSAGSISVRLDPQGDGSLFPYADLSDTILNLRVPSGQRETFTRSGSGRGAYMATDLHKQDWSAAINWGRELQLLGVEFAIDIKPFVLGSCGHAFGLAFVNGEIPNQAQMVGWPDGMNNSLPASWQTVMLSHSVCPDQPPGRIVFACQPFGRADRQQVCMVNSYGSGYRNLTDAPGFQFSYPSFTPDGTSLIYISDRTGSPEIYALDLENFRETQLTENIGDLASPVISLRGDRIAFTNQKDYADQPYAGPSIWLMGRSGEKPHRLVGMPWGYAWDPVWSPNGEQILFVSDREGTPQLYVVDVAGGEPAQLNRIDNLRGVSDWSRSGQIAAYVGAELNQEILIMNSDGSEIHTITAGGNNLMPSFSPDGDWIAFTSYRDHGYKDAQGCEIYVMRADGTEVHRLTDNNTCDWQPNWSPFGEIELAR